MSGSLYYSAKAVAVGPRSSKPEKDETGMPHTIEEQIKATYFALRAGAALIAFVFPLLLWGGGKLAGFSLRDSMSAYYWATPTQLCPCGENPDGTCVKKATKAEVSRV